MEDNQGWNGRRAQSAAVSILEEVSGWLPEEEAYMNIISGDAKFPPSEADRPGPDALFSDGPPCLERLVQIGGFRGEARENALRNAALYFKNKPSGDRWKTQIHALNEQVCAEPVPHDQVENLIKSFGKQGRLKSYTCGATPLCDHCKREVCETRPFGVEPDRNAMFYARFGQLRKLETDPPTWFWQVGDRELRLTTEELQSPRLFQKRCVEELNAMPTLMSAEKWQKFVNESLAKVSSVEMPDDASDEGQIMELLRNYCTGYAQARVPAEIKRGNPWADPETGIIWFSIRAFQEFLQRRQFHSSKAKVHNLSALFLARGLTNKKKIGSEEIRVWGVDFKAHDSAHE